MADLTKQLNEYRSGIDKVNDALKTSQEMNAKLIEGIGKTVLAYDKIIQSSAKYSRAQKKDAKAAAKAIKNSVNSQMTEMSRLEKFIMTKLRAQKGVWAGFHRMMYNVPMYFKFKNNVDVTLSTIDRLISKKKELREAEGKRGFGWFSGEYEKAEEIMNSMADSRKKLIERKESKVKNIESKMSSPQLLIAKQDNIKIAKRQKEITRLEASIKRMGKGIGQIKSKKTKEVARFNKAPNDGTRNYIMHNQKMSNWNSLIERNKTQLKADAITLKYKQGMLTKATSLGKIKGMRSAKKRIVGLNKGTEKLRNAPNSMNTNMKNFATYFGKDKYAKQDKKFVDITKRAEEALVANLTVAKFIDLLRNAFYIKKFAKKIMPIFKKLGLMAMVVMKAIVFATLTILGIYMLWKASGLTWKNVKTAFTKLWTTLEYFGQMIFDGLANIYGGFKLIYRAFTKEGNLGMLLEGLGKVFWGVGQVIIGAIGLIVGTALMFIVNLLIEMKENFKAKVAENVSYLPKVMAILGAIILAFAVVVAFFTAGPLLAGISGVVAAVGIIALGVGGILSAVNYLKKKFGGGRAEGGVVSGGMTLVGEKGPELVSLPTGSRVHSNSQSKRMGVGGNTNITVNVQGRIGSSDNELRQIAEKVGAMINKEINRTTSSGTMR